MSAENGTSVLRMAWMWTSAELDMWAGTLPNKFDNRLIYNNY